MIHRLAHRYLQAMEFDNEKALKRYLKEHPKADPSKHTVKPPSEEEEIELSDEDLEEVQPEPSKKKPPSPPPPPPPTKQPPKEHKEDGHGESHDPHPPKKTWKEVAQDLSGKAKKFLETAPKNVKKFAEDDSYRRKVTMDAHSALTNAPEKSVKQLLRTFKEEVHEYKEAAHAVGDLAKGKKLDQKQKHALKTVAFHVGLTVAATALTTSGLGAGAAVFAKSMARHVALKAIGSMFEKAHILDEIGHVGHGVKHILEKLAAKRKPTVAEEPTEDNDRLLYDFVTALVAKELEGFSAEDVGDVVEKSTQKHDVHEASILARRYVLASYKNVTASEAEGVQWVIDEVLSQKVDGDTLANHIHKYLRDYIKSGQAIHDLFRKAMQQSKNVEGWENITYPMMAKAVYKYVVKEYGDDAMFKLIPFLITKGDFVL